jgi:hypothetical protein
MHFPDMYKSKWFKRLLQTYSQARDAQISMFNTKQIQHIQNKTNQNPNIDALLYTCMYR